MCLTNPHSIAGNHAPRALATSIPSYPLLGALQAGTLWNHNEEIPISFMPRSGTESTDQQRKKTKMLFEEIFRHTNLSLLWLNDGDGIVRIAFNDETLSQSQVRTKCRDVSQNKWTINLKSIMPDNDCPSPNERHTINHECMHLLAFVHEHQVPEWPSHFSFNRHKVIKAYGGDESKGGIPHWQIESNIMTPYTPEKLENYSPFDRKSVLLYQFSGDVMQNGLGTPFNPDLSDIDKAVLVLNYPRLNPGPLVPRWTVSYAADVIGIKGESREKIVAATHPHDVRRLYSEWSKRSQRFQQGEVIEA